MVRGRRQSPVYEQYVMVTCIFCPSLFFLYPFSLQFAWAKINGLQKKWKGKRGKLLAGQIQWNMVKTYPRVSWTKVPMKRTTCYPKCNRQRSPEKKWRSPPPPPPWWLLRGLKSHTKWMAQPRITDILLAVYSVRSKVVIVKLAENSIGWEMSSGPWVNSV